MLHGEKPSVRQYILTSEFEEEKFTQSKDRQKIQIAWQFRKSATHQHLTIVTSMKNPNSTNHNTESYSQDKNVRMEVIAVIKEHLRGVVTVRTEDIVGVYAVSIHKSSHSKVNDLDLHLWKHI